MRQAGLFGLSEHLKRLSAHGDPLEELGRIIDFEAFRPELGAALAYGDGVKGGRPPYDPVVMLKVLVLAAQNNVADARMEYLIRDRLSWLRFLGFDLGAQTRTSAPSVVRQWMFERATRLWKMPPREWSMAKAQFAVIFGERFIKAMAA